MTSFQKDVILWRYQHPATWYKQKTLREGRFFAWGISAS